MKKPIEMPNREEFHSWSEEQKAEFLNNAAAFLGPNCPENDKGLRTRIIIEHYHPQIVGHKMESCVIDFNVSALVTGKVDCSVKMRNDFSDDAVKELLKAALSIMGGYKAAEAVPCDPNGKPLVTQ